MRLSMKQIGLIMSLFFVIGGILFGLGVSILDTTNIESFFVAFPLMGLGISVWFVDTRLEAFLHRYADPEQLRKYNEKKEKREKLLENMNEDDKRFERDVGIRLLLTNIAIVIVLIAPISLLRALFVGHELTYIIQAVLITSNILLLFVAEFWIGDRLRSRMRYPDSPRRVTPEDKRKFVTDMTYASVTAYTVLIAILFWYGIFLTEDYIGMVLDEELLMFVYEKGTIASGFCTVGLLLTDLIITVSTTIPNPRFTVKEDS